LQTLYATPCFLSPIQLTLTLTPRVLGTCYYVLLLQVLCRMKKWIGGVKQAFSSSPSSQGSSSCSDDGSQDSSRSSFFVPSPHETEGLIRYPAHDDVATVTDGDDISINHGDGERSPPSSGPTPLMVTPSLSSKPELPPMLDTLTCTLFWSGTSVMRLTRLSTWCMGSDDSSNGWMTLQLCKQKCKNPSTHRPG
jgi:hypothetical protein